MAIQIKLRYSQPAVQTDRLVAYGLQVEVVNAVDMPSKIFVFQRAVQSATDPEANTLGDKFVSVADPVDLEQYPEDVPDVAHAVPYYRKAAVTFVFRSVAELEEVKALLDADVTRLVESLKALATLPVQAEVTYE